MIDILIAAVVAIVLLGLWNPPRLRRLAQWRVAAGLLPIGLFAAAGFLALRDEWAIALILALLGCGLAVSARWPWARAVVRPQSAMSLDDARAMLGVDAGATEAEIQAAYLRLMRRVHPDNGGASGLASQLNIARDRLLKR